MTEQPNRPIQEVIREMVRDPLVLERIRSAYEDALAEGLITPQKAAQGLEFVERMEREVAEQER